MQHYAELQNSILRRTFLKDATLGLGTLALGNLLAPASALASVEGIVSPPHMPQRAKRVIHLCMAGGPSQFETFDYKPILEKQHGEAMPDSFTRGQPIAQLQGQELRCFGPQFKFHRHGRSGQEISELLPQIGSIADDICIVRSMRTEQINHDPAHTFMNTGTAISGRPSMGSWVTYGLGSECDDLPGFVVMISRAGNRSPQPVASRQWHSGFLPSKYQGVQFYSEGDPVHFVTNPPGVDREMQFGVVETVNKLNRVKQMESDNPEVATRIAQYELAFRMQMSVPKLVDISEEPRNILDLYGIKGADGSFAYNCLLARRLAERGVRFIQLYHRDWDHHDDIGIHMPVLCASADQASAALIIDLKQRGMLDDTLVIWGGEFGRTPMAQGTISNTKSNGRDHHIRGFSIWMAGGGITPGMTYGATDELGYNAVENPVHVHDLHATILHQLGIDHERLTYRYQGRDFRLTDVAGKVVTDILG